MKFYIAKQHKNAIADLTPTTYGTIMQFGRSVEDVGHKPYMDNLGDYISSPV
jgi:hypothetical protein